MDATTPARADDEDDADDPGAVGVSPDRRRARRPLLVLLGLVAAGVYVLDQLTKWLAVRHLTGDQPVPLVGTLLQLRLVHNPGAAFSLATGLTWVLTLLAVVVIVAIIRVSARLGSRAWALALGLLLGGAVGNLTDRLVRPPAVGRGHVVDFIAYGNWFVGNVADIAIVAAACLVVLLSLAGLRVDGARERDRSSAREGSGA